MRVQTHCSCVKYVAEPEDSMLLHTALDVYRKFQQYPQALRLAMVLNEPSVIQEVFLECPDRCVYMYVCLTVCVCVCVCVCDCDSVCVCVCVCV